MTSQSKVVECDRDADDIIRGTLPLVLKWTVDRQLVQAVTEKSRDEAALITHLIERKLAEYVITPTLKRRQNASVEEALDEYQGPRD